MSTTSVELGPSVTAERISSNLTLYKIATSGHSPSVASSVMERSGIGASVHLVSEASSRLEDGVFAVLTDIPSAHNIAVMHANLMALLITAVVAR